jgi:transcriptional regulator with XRE-family HTH domain
MPKIPTLGFANTLRNAMAEQQMTQSDVARAVWGNTTDPRGYQVAKNRDRIGAYLAGTGYPSKETLPKLCKAVGLSMDKLPPATRSTAPRAGARDFSFSILPDETVFIEMRKVVSMDIGLKILQLVTEAR